jgi:hypothetical protein
VRIVLQIKTYPTLEAMRHLNEVRGKFVQLNWKGEPWLLFAARDQHGFHNQIVAHFMSDLHLPYHWQSPEILNFDQPGLQIVGGGKFWLNWREKQLILSDNSMVYGRFKEAGVKEALLSGGLPWAGFEIEIR